MNCSRPSSLLAIPAASRVVSSLSFRQLRRALGWIARSAVVLLAGTVAAQAQTAHFSGVQTTVVASVNVPSAIALDQSGSVNSGSLFVSSYSGGVERYTLSGSTWNDAGQVTSLTGPNALTVDPNGNLYVSNPPTHSVYKETLDPGTHTYTETVAVSGLSVPWGLAFDSYGQLYVANHDSDEVIQYTLSNGNWVAQNTYTVAGHSVAGVAVDSNLNIYITTQDGSGIVVKETNNSGSYSASTLFTITGSSGTAVMTDIKVDAAGNLYIADQTNSRVLKESLENGSYVQSTLGSGYIGETGVVLDAAGDIYVSDWLHQRAVEVKPNGASLGSSAVGTVSATAVTIPWTFTGAGVLGAVKVLTQGKQSLDFNDADTGSCLIGHNYSAGDVCTTNVTFTPTQIGTRYGAAAIYNNSGQIIAMAPLYGIGTGPLVNFTPYTRSTLPGTFNIPEGISGLGDGSLIIADSNNVYKETYSAGSYTKSTIVASTDSIHGHTLNSTQWVATDGAGNLYLADGGNGRILKIPLESGGYSQADASLVCSSGCGGNQIAVDSNGNVYTLSGATHAVQKFTLQPDGSYQYSVAYNSGLNNPWGIAVDAAGNIFFTDADNDALYKLTPTGSTYSFTTLATGLHDPTGIALDTNGNIYVTEFNVGGHEDILKETFISGTTYTQSTLLTNINPVGVWVDNSGNVFASNSLPSPGAVYRYDTADAPTIAFGNQTVASTSSATSITLANNGTSALNIEIPTSGLNPLVTGEFTLGTSSGSDCAQLSSSSSSVATIATGSTCVLAISFAPTTGGSLTGSVAITDNNLNAAGPTYATQSISLTGTGVIPTPTVTGLNPTSGSTTGGSTVAITGTGFLTASAVKFGTTAATSFTINSDTSITTVSPAGSAGAVDVTVTNPTATSATSAADQFSYLSATVAVASKTLTAQGPATNFTPVTGSGGVASLTYSIAPSLPTGLSVSSTTGAITGTPAAASALTTYTVTVTDANSTTNSAQFTLLVNPAVVATAAVPSKALTATTATSFTPITATGGTGTLAYAISPALPTGLAFSTTTGAITGTPTSTSATTTYTVTATDTLGASSSSTFTLVVNPAVTATTAITAKTITANVAATPFTPVTATGGTGTLSYSISPTLPAGLMFSTATGSITGTPTAASTSTPYTVTATDTNSASAHSSFTLTVNPAVTATTAVSSTTLTANQAAIAFTPVTATGGTGTLSYSISPTLPAGLMFGTATGSITGTPTATSTSTPYTVTATDQNAATSSATFSLTVLAPPLSLSPAALTVPQVGVAYSQTLTASGGIAPYTYSVGSGSLPAGLTLSSTGTLSGTPTTGQTASFTIVAVDSSPGSGPYSVSASYSVTVTPGHANLAFAAGTSSANYTYGQAPVTLSSSSVSTGAITYSVVSGPATVNATSGAVTFGGAGSVVVQASQAATANYVATTAQATLTVGKQSTAIGVAASSTSITPVQPIALTATVAPASLGSPTGTVTFYDNGTAISSAIALVQGSAQLQLASLLSGSHSIAVSYSGDANFLAASASGQTVTPINITVAPLTFTLNLAGSGKLTAEPGSTVQFSVAVNPTHLMFPGTVTFAVTGLPTGATYSVSPASLAANAGPQQVTVSVTLPTATATNRHAVPWQRPGYLAVALLLPLLAGLRRGHGGLRSGMRLLAVLAAAALGVTSLTGCGSGTGYFNSPVQNYAVTFTATSGTVAQSTVVNLQVQ